MMRFIHKATMSKPTNQNAILIKVNDKSYSNRQCLLDIQQKNKLVEINVVKNCRLIRIKIDEPGHNSGLSMGNKKLR